MSTDELDAGTAVVALTGEIDLYTAPELKQELVRLIDTGVRALVVDLSTTTFLDSTTLGVLISGVKRLRPVRGRLELVVVDPAIRKVFEITGLDRVFALHETRAAALATARSAEA